MVTVPMGLDDDDDDDNGFALIGLMLGYRDDRMGAMVGLFEDSGEREFTGIRDGCKYGILLG